MKLIDMISLKGSAIGLSPAGTNHPPSLKNPIPVKQPFKGWDPDASERDRQQAIADLLETIERTKRQAGKPAVAQTAAVPVRPILG
jgi:hypothetical protein